MSKPSKHLNEYFLIYYAFCRRSRIFITDLCKEVKLARNTVTKYLEECKENDVLFPPQLRLKMTKQGVEYVYLVKVTDPLKCLPFLEEQKAFYVCFLSGIYNLMFMSYEPISISHIPEYKQTFLSGIRSNFVSPKIPHQSFERSYEKIELKLKSNPEPSLLSLDLPEGIPWSEHVWFLYHVLKYDYRLKFTPIIKKYNISVSSFYDWLKKIKMQSDVFVPFYPLGQMQYTIFHLLIKSRYHQFLIDCFGEFPVFSLHCRIKDYLFSRLAISKRTETRKFLKLLTVVQHLGFIDEYEMCLPFDSLKNHPGIPDPAPSP